MVFLCCTELVTQHRIRLLGPAVLLVTQSLASEYLSYLILKNEALWLRSHHIVGSDLSMAVDVETLDGVATAAASVNSSMNASPDVESCRRDGSDTAQVKTPSKVTSTLLGRFQMYIFSMLGLKPRIVDLYPFGERIRISLWF